ncbi:ComEC/Rec2 family competence protein [uncultured Polaribacter sp.]|uniref:ComEC/Rec2 family competence protein n=1 Tax=uncultured Polaribacter sp. TaxID=174711 RepID=UPI00261C6F24|nr:ComEC/Rec2 family competence protein [uncultured Polaribacter sp.]
MKRLFNYLPLHFVVLGILGICSQFFTNFWTVSFLKTFLILGLLSITLFIFKNKVLRTLIAFTLFFLLGVSSVIINDHRNYDSFYENYIQDNSKIVLQIHKVLKPGNFYLKYEAKIINVDTVKTNGVILLNVKKDSIINPFNVDERLLVSSAIKELIPPLNPHQFNYKSYLEKQGIYHQLFIDKTQFFKLNTKSNTLFGLSSKFRNQIQKSLKKYNFEDNELAVINALLLGQRQDISKELITDYQRAGAIHILAVSGLHVGIILLILSFIFTPLEKLKYGNFIKTVVIVLLLWMFAFIAGLSASVVRAVTMFTFLAIGMSFNRKNVVSFSFVTSMFFLLLIKPMFLFDVGFQLSYLAVFGILWTQPKIYSIWKPKNKIIDFFWQLFTVSIAAQIGILPLSIYYFQQFPGLFLASNLVIIPFLGAILIGGVLVIVTSLINILPQFLVDFYGTIISLMNAFVSWISHQEEFLFKEISISFLMMICYYVFIFLGVYFLIKKSPQKLVYFLISILILQGVFMVELNQNKTKNEIIVFHKSRFSVIGKRIGERLLLQHNLDSLKLKKENSISSYKVSEGINEVAEINFKNYIKFYNKDILLIDSLGVYNVVNLNRPIIVLQYSPKINLTRMIKKIKPSQIIADGSNYKSYILRWEKTCLINKIPFHYTGQKGAFIIKE